MDPRPKTIFLDIDGCILKHSGSPCDRANSEPEILPGVLDKFNEWDMKGHKIILVTGRRENTRAQTERQLNKFGLFWDQLIMGVGGGQRWLINDLKPGANETAAISVNLERNAGMANLEI